MVKNKQIIASILHANDGYHVSVRKFNKTNDKQKELFTCCLSSIEEVAAFLEDKHVFLAVIETVYPIKSEAMRLRNLNDYTKKTVYLVMLLIGHELFTVDHDKNIICVGVNSPVNLDGYCTIAIRAVRGK